MIGITNSGFGGSGGVAFIQVTYPVGSSCTCTNSTGTRTYRAKDTSGSCVFNIKDPGVWTVSCTDGTDSDSKDVTVANYDSISIKLNYESMEKLANDVAGWDLPLLVSWPDTAYDSSDNTTNDYFYLENSNNKRIRTSTEAVIFIPFTIDAYRNGWGIGVITRTPTVISYTGFGSMRINGDPAKSYFETENHRKLYLIYDVYNTSGTTSSWGMHTYRDKVEKTVSGVGTIDDSGINIAIYRDTYKLVTFGTRTTTRDLNLAKFNEALNRYALLTGAEAVTS